MALTVEDGTGLEDAESYVSVADADAYHDGRGNTEWDVSDEELKEQALRRATTYLEGRYAGRWPGTKINGRSQALSWPRADVLDSAGDAVAEDEVPREVVAATAEAALREIVTPGSLTPDYVPSDRVTSETVGPVSVTYADPGADSEVRPVVTLIDEILWPLLVAGSGGAAVALMRA